MATPTRRPAGIGPADRPTGDLGRAALSWLVFVVALGLAGVASVAARGAGLSGDAARAVPALVVGGVVAPLVLALHGRVRWAPVLALVRPVRVVVGALVVLGAAAAVLAADHLAGGVRLVGVDVAVLVRWLLTTLALALALEALPEELAFRGGVFGGLRRVLPGWLAATVTTAAFVVAPGCAIWVTARLGRVLGVDTDPATFAPGGPDPVAYAVLLAVFGAVLLLVRAVAGSVWACVGFHLAFLVVNRLLVGDADTTGVAVDAPPGSELLVVAHLVVAAVVLVLVLLRRRRGGARRR